MKQKYNRNIKIVFVILIMYCYNFNAFSQNYVNDMDYVLGDSKQAFIQDKITTETQADNLLLGFKNMGVNGIRIPLFGKDINGNELNPNKPMFDYFYEQALAQGFVIFANPAQGGGGARVANNMLNGDVPSVNGDTDATNTLILRVLEFAAEYPECKWINPFNEDGRATSSTWTVNQINTIYSSLYNNLTDMELVGPCTWGLPAGIDMLQNTDISDYITVATTHNLGFNHNRWAEFISLADAKNLPVWDSEVNNNDKYPEDAVRSGTRIERAIENEVDGLVLYDSWKSISLTSGSVSSGGEALMALYLIQEEVVNLALDGAATQSSTNPSWNMEASRAIDGDTAGSFASGNGSISLTNSEENPWWQVDLGSDKEIGNIKVYNRTDSCCKDRMSNFTVSVINSSGVTVFSKTYTTYPDPSVIVDTDNVQGQIVKVQLNATNALALAEVQVFSSVGSLSVEDTELIKVNVYPNPFIDKFKVVTANAIFNQYEIYNTHGQLILSNKIVNSTNEIEIDLCSFSKGLYLVKLNGDNSSRTYKIIKD